jgi:hypothetical protein
VNKKAVTLILLVSLLAIPLMTAMQTAKADVYTSSYIAYGSGVCLYSPLNKTYTSGSLLLNLTFGQGIGFQCHLSYSIDSQSFSEIPMTAPSSHEYQTIVQTEVPPILLPVLKDGSHCLAINVNASTEGYTHSWVHTVYFTVDTGEATLTPTPMAVTSPTPNSPQITDANQTNAVLPTPQPSESAPVAAIIVLVAIAVYAGVIVVLATRKVNP